MEEAVGKLWHRAITKIATRRHPKEAASLHMMARSLGLLYRACGGEWGQELISTTATRHNARRNWLAWLAGIGTHAELAWCDSEALRLPEVIDLFPDAGLNRDLYRWLTALAAQTSDGSDWFIAQQKASQHLLARFPGFAATYGRLLPAVLELRPNPHALPDDEAAAEVAIRKALKEPGNVISLPHARRPWAPIVLWLHPWPPSVRSSFSAHDSPANARGKRPTEDPNTRRHYRVEHVAAPTPRTAPLVQRPETMLVASEFEARNCPEIDADSLPFDHQAPTLDQLSLARDQSPMAAGLNLKLDLQIGDDQSPARSELRLPEWNWRAGEYRPDWCALSLLKDPPQAGSGTLPEHLRADARRLRAQFQALAPSRIWLRGQPDGTEIDLDAWLRQRTEPHAAPGPARIYRDARTRTRDLACLVLADLSLSTEAAIHADCRIIDIIRDSLYLLGEAFDAGGDRFALAGFNSQGRAVQFIVFKNFAAHYGNQARARLAAAAPHGYTRMGAAIRQASGLLAKETARTRLLLLITDGKPNDQDVYEGRYGIEDTRAALRETRQAGLNPFCITVDQRSADYLPYLFGRQGYLLVRRLVEMPRRLPQLVLQLMKNR